jgi:hypothetical protein
LTGRLILAVAAALVAAIAVIRNAVVAQYAESRPDIAMRVWPGHPATELWQGLTEIGRAAGTRGAVSTATLARIRDAAVKSPLAPEPFLVRGVEAQLANDPALAQRAFLAAKLRDGRSIPARYFLAELYFRRGDARQGLREISTLSKMVPNGVTNLAPFVAAYAKEPRTRTELKALFRSDPSLEQAALTTLAADAANTDLILSLATPSATPPAWAERLLRSLVDAGDYARARSVWGRLSHVVAGPDQLIFDPGFEASDAPPPFNWTLVSSTLGLAERQPGGRLHVMYYGQEDGVLASQLLVLRPGTYRLGMQVAGDLPHAATLAWTLTCSGSKAVLASRPLNDAARWNEGVAFNVPPGCAAQQLELAGRSPDIAHQTDVTISRLRLTREAPNG